MIGKGDPVAVSRIKHVNFDMKDIVTLPCTGH